MAEFRDTAPLSCVKVLDTLNLALFHEYDKGIQSEVEVDDQLWTTKLYVVSVMCLLQNKEMFLLKIMLMLS